jgi:uncharacterized membrane protein
MLLVYLTGVLELAMAVGFLVPWARRLTGRVAAGALVLFFPANVYAAVSHVPIGGHAEGPVYLLIRAPLQAVILFWVYWFDRGQDLEDALSVGLLGRIHDGLPWHDR